MMCMKMLFEFAFVSPTILTSIIISFSNLVTEMLPTPTTIVRYTTSPVRMIIAPILLTAKHIIAFPRTEVMLLVYLCLSFIQANKSTADFTRYYREIRVVIICIAELMRPSSSKMNGVASGRTPLPDFGLPTISNKLFATNFAYQLCHSYIIPQYPSINKGEDYRRMK